jgi:hypothetical protein
MPALEVKGVAEAVPTYAVEGFETPSGAAP